MAEMASDDIGLMTLAAAQEVDLRLAGAKPNTDTFRILGRLLSEFSGPVGRSDVAFLNSDPRAIQILTRALEDYSPDRHVKDVDMLLEQIKDITEPLQTEVAELDAVKLKKFKSFCLSLHRAIAATEIPSFHEWEYKVDGEFGLC